MGKTSESQRYLNSRLSRARQSKPAYYEEVTLPKPAAVIEAEKRIARDSKIVERFERKQHAARKTRNERIAAAADAIQREILFGTPKKALAMLDRFEQAKF